MLSALCVYSGSSPGSKSSYYQAAESLGRVLAKNQIKLIYGGGNVGLMGAIANASLQAGGEVVGVITEHLMQMEVGHLEVTKLHITKTMHQRKMLMAELSDGFVAMPGGIGTLEELFEVFTWAQLGVHHKPCALLNVDGFYDPLLAMIRHMVEQRFLKQAHSDYLLVETQASRLLQRLQQHQPAPVPKLTN